MRDRGGQQGQWGSRHAWAPGTFFFFAFFIYLLTVIYKCYTYNNAGTISIPSTLPQQTTNEQQWQLSPVNDCKSLMDHNVHEKGPLTPFVFLFFIFCEPTNDKDQLWTMFHASTTTGHSHWAFFSKQVPALFLGGNPHVNQPFGLFHFWYPTSLASTSLLLLLWYHCSCIYVLYTTTQLISMLYIFAKKIRVYIGLQFSCEKHNCPIRHG